LDFWWLRSCGRSGKGARWSFFFFFLIPFECFDLDEIEETLRLVECLEFPLTDDFF